MDFQLSDEQVLLRDTTRSMLSGYDTETRNKVIETEPGFNPEVWKQLAEVGILGLGFDPEESGPLEVMVVLTEIGRRLAPEPVVHGALGPGALIVERGDAQQRALLDSVAEGDHVLAFAHTEPGMRGTTPVVTTTAVPQGDSWRLSGRKNPVLTGDRADTLVVSAALPDGGTGLFLVDGGADGLTRHGYRTFDGQRGAQIDLADTPATALGEPTDATAAIERALIRISSALCAEAVGAMEESLRLTSDYLKTRKQFGVTLNTFQTLTQRAADMYVSLELARSMSMYAAMSLADDNYDPLIAARAKLQVGRSGRHIAQEAIQLHGGIGVTWEYPVGHYAARLTAIEHTLGSSQDQLRVLIDNVGGYGLAKL
ncbi:acyl-CoA dehydrogenase family protein [Mycolicibacter arupensis]|uniref:Acyl-CoA dehydrogenase n=1 Tax=Mycolicibacter arupensis TaxID=342002 RepID=A0A0F5N580_9MYCO|nr:acyl-CoA dehydrogenase family protein [Mycolicibacter arupensis]KAA1430428.1 acyl-CoA dehydrogenase [Mycolicibacter arupensis]KKC01443.1 acyl-CoA dehydrogenase [Mycolicibacter arupensis]MCV7276930.1 acyl-CoA dehydrogenase family protein [Mycolicibacter arupensis]ORA00958.1 acyl-CoA dehydrogenase [Mycolicibacter arupensis]TXI60564.1 MAG: acyl-CoA dehydrogenase [Mycolicibacter arupensis]